MALVLAVLAGLTLFAAPPALAQPTVSTATVNGDNLTLTFSQSLGTGLASAAAFTLTAGDEEIALVYDEDQDSPISVPSLGWFEAKLEKDVHRGVTVKLSYDPALVDSGDVPLSDPGGNNVAKFTDRAVSNNTSEHQPLLGSAVVNGATLTLTYSHELSTAQKPATSAYTVQVGEDARAVTNVRIVPMTKKVELTLASAVTDTDTVKVSYDKPATNPLRGKAASTDAPSFTDYAVTNDTPDTTAPKFSSAAVDGKQLKVTFDETLDTDSAPSGGAFTVKATVGGVTRSITGTGTADIAAATVTVVLGSAVLSTDTTVTVAYVKPGSNPLQDAASNEVTDFSGQTATNNSDAPEFSSAAVDGKQLKVTFDEALDTGSAPSGGAFTVSATVGGVTRSITGTGTADIGAATVTVVLGSAVLSTDTTVTVAYAKPGSNPLQEALGNEVAAFTGQTVTNNSDAPEFSSAAVDGKQLKVTFDENLDTGSAPSGGAFTVSATVDSTTRTITGTGTADIAAATVTVVLGSAVLSTDTTVTVAYAKPGSNPLQEALGNEVAAFTGQTVTNNSDAPEFSSAAVDGKQLKVTFDEDLDTGSAPSGGAFTVSATVGSTTRSITGTGTAEIDAATVTVVLGSAVLSTETTVTVAYVKPGSNPLQEALGNEVAAFSGQTVTNNSDAPEFSSAAVDGKQLKVTFDENLDTGSAPSGDAFTVSATVGGTTRSITGTGTAEIDAATVTVVLDSVVLSTETVTVGYAKPGSNPLQDAASNEVATFTGQTADNNSDPPGVSSATVNRRTLTIVFDEELNQSRVGHWDEHLTLTVDDNEWTINSVSTYDSDDHTIEIRIERVRHGQTVKLSYAKPDTDPIRDVAGNEMESFTDRAVTNDTPAVAPEFSSAAVNDATLEVTFDENLDTSAVPATSAFTVTVGTNARNVSSVAISDKVVTLTLASAVIEGDTVQVRYTKPTTGNKLRSASNSLEVATFSNQTVTNNTDSTAPTFQSAAVDGTDLKVTFTEELDSTSTPATTAFIVTVGTTARGVSSVAISDEVVTLTLASAVTHTDQVKVRYTKPATGATLRDTASTPNAVVTFVDQAVTNNTGDTVKPVFSSAAVDEAALTITFNENLNSSSTPATSAFIVTVGTTARGVNSVDILDDVVTLTLASAVIEGEAVKVRYDKPTTGDTLQDTSANEVDTFSDKTVTNNTEDTDPPLFSSAAVVLTALTVTFDEDLDTGSVPAPGDFRATVNGVRRLVATNGVAVQGAAVILTLASPVTGPDLVQISYTQPGNNPLKDPFENKVADFGTFLVDNNTPPVFRSASVKRKTLTVTFSEELDSNSVPAPGDFTVTVAGSTRTVASVGMEVNAVEVVLTLTSAVSESEVVRVRYAKPMSNPLRGNRGNTVEVEDFNDQQVSNDTDDTAPVFQSAAVDRDDLTVTFGETLDEDSVPAPGDFIVTVAGSPRAVASDGVEVDGATVILTLTSAVTGGDAVLVRYTQPANGPLQDSEENKVATFNDQTVANGTRPEYTGATVNGDSLTVNFDDALDTGSVPAPGDFTVTVAGNSRAVASGGVAVDATTVTLTLASAVTAIDVVTVEYTPPSSNPLRGINNAGVESFTGLDVTNNTPPAFQSAAVNGAELTITFNEALDTGSVPAPGDFVVTVADPPPDPPDPSDPPDPPDRRDVIPDGVDIDGAAVTLTLVLKVVAADIVQVSYTKPADNPLRDEDGNEVETFAAAQDVENSTGASPPAFRSASVRRDRLTVNFDEHLDAGSVPPPAAFTVTVDGIPRDVAAGGVAIARWTVTLTLASSVKYTDPVTVRYTRPDENPLRDEDGDEVVTFGNEDVANNTVDDEPPVFESAEVNGDKLTVTFDEALDTASMPVPGAFTVTVNGIRRTVAAGGVAINGRTVTLTLASAVRATDSVRVRYSRPASNRLRDGVGNAVATFGNNRAVNVTPDNTPPQFVSASVNRKALTLTFDEALDPASVPRKPGGGFVFTVTVDGLIHGVSSSDRFVAGRTVTLTLDSEVEHDENDVKVRYTKPNQRPLRDPRGNEVVTFGAQPVTNDHTAQTVFVSATVKGSTLDIVLNRVIPGDPVDDAVRLYVNGALHPDVDDYYSGSSLGYILTPPVKAHDTVTVSFVKPPPGQPQLVDIEGNEVASYSNKPVVNITPDTEPPELMGAVARGTALTLVFNEDLDTVAAPPANAFTVGGIATPPTVDEAAFHPTDDTRVVLTLSEAVARGDAATVSYVKPGSDPLRDLDENEVVDFTEPVTFTSSPPPPGVQPPPPAATAPSFGSAAVAALALDRARAMAPVVLPRATGGDGELTYSLTSAPAGLAGLDFDAATRRLSGTPGRSGSWTFTYRAEDADDDRTDSDAAVLTFDVRVAARDQAATAAVKRTLAAVATRTLSSALGHIGLRLTGVLPTGALTLAGRRLEFAAPGMGVEGAAGACAWGGFDRYGLDRYGFDRHGLGDARRDGLGSGGGCEGWSRGIGTDELLRASAFSWLLGAAEGSGGADPAAARWAVWGRGDFSDFSGRPEGMSYDGKARSGWLGVDARKGRWVAGLALSHGVSEADYSYGGGAAGGRLETTLTALYPYGRWTLAEGLEVRGVLGAGSGEARHMPGDAEAATSDLTMRMGSAGVRRELLEVAGIELAARADASLVRMEIEAGPEFIGGVSADSWRARVGLEGKRRLALGEGTALTPFMEVAGRRDGGDGLEGSGLEVAGGVRYTAPRVEVEARGRLLAAHAEEGARERGVSVTARLGPGARGRGLSLSLKPRWGAGTGGAEALWRDELPGLSGDGEEAALDARIGYGVGLAERGLLTPFVEAGMSKGRRLRVGTRFDGWRADLGMELSGERREDGNGEAEHGVLLDLRLRF